MKTNPNRHTEREEQLIKALGKVTERAAYALIALMTIFLIYQLLRPVM